MLTVLQLLLHSNPAPLHVASLDEMLSICWEKRKQWALPVDRALALGFGSDRLGYAFAAGYDAALHALAPNVPSEYVTAFCATEDDGAHPKAIKTTLTPNEAGGFLLNGRKKWATLATEARELLVVATIGKNEQGKNQLRLVQVAARSKGVRVTPMPTVPFTPEVTHAEIEFNNVEIGEWAVMPGDGYDEYVKPFRTIEDIHVHAALIGYLISVARRSQWPKAVIERLAASAICIRELARSDPKDPGVHLVLAGCLEHVHAISSEYDRWEWNSGEEKERWERDRPLLGVAERAREMRRQRAWEVLESNEGEGRPSFVDVIA